jgi:hypothetical protein
MQRLYLGIVCGLLFGAVDTASSSASMANFKAVWSLFHVPNLANASLREAIFLPNL